MSARSALHGEPANRSEGGVPQRTYITGMAVALCGVLLFFASLLSAWVVRKGLAGAPEVPLDLPAELLGANTFVLIFSSAMLDLARRRLRAGNERGFSASWQAAIAIGGVFLLGQAMVLRQLAARGVRLSSSPDASFFYLLSAAHGAHLIVGIAGLIAAAWWPLHRMKRTTAARVAAMYWHFLTAVWTCIFLFLTVYGG